jgi:NAD(P)-dependent dehydrogenase (short-subunit alcohol dehydrogenase family)
MPTLSSNKQLLLIGASRGLGFALAEEYLKRGWHIVATERSRTTSQLHNLLEASDCRLEIETVDITYPDQVAALRARLASRKFDMLFVNAGVGTREMVADDELERAVMECGLKGASCLPPHSGVRPAQFARAIARCRAWSGQWRTRPCVSRLGLSPLNAPDGARCADHAGTPDRSAPRTDRRLRA